MEKDKGLIGNEKIVNNIKKLKADMTDENLAILLTTLRKRALDGGQFVVAVDANGGDNLALRTANMNGKKWFISYTDFDEELKGNLDVMSGFLADMDKTFDMALMDDSIAGIILNPYGESFALNKQLISVIKGL